MASGVVPHLTLPSVSRLLSMVTSFRLLTCRSVLQWNQLGFFTRTIHFVWGMLSFFLFISGLFSVQAFVQISPSVLPLLTLSRRILMKASYVISILAFPTPNSPFVHLLLLWFLPVTPQFHHYILPRTKQASVITKQMCNSTCQSSQPMK